MNLEILKTPKMGFLVSSEFLKKKKFGDDFFLIFVFCVSIELLKYENTHTMDKKKRHNTFTETISFLKYENTLMSYN